MSTYSLLTRAPAELRSSWMGDTSPKSSANDHELHYPTVTTSHAGQLPMSPSPHPYQLAAYSSPMTPSDAGFPIAPDTPSYPSPHTIMNSQPTNEKPPQSIAQPRYPDDSTQQPNSTSSNDRPALLLSPVVLFMLFLPLPVLLSLLYLLVGHAILRHTHPLPNPAYQVSLSASVEAGAAGGAILTLPLALLLYLLIGPINQPPPSAPEDFFEDDESSIFSQHKWFSIGACAVCALLVVCIGGAAGPLGVTCLSGGDRKMLRPARAAEAGLVGGVLLSAGLAILSTIAVFLWFAGSKSKPRLPV